jgi:hypothetical protein
VAFFAALDGGDGMMEATVKDSTVTTSAEATARITQILSERAMPIVHGTFRVRTSLLSAGSIFKVGQYVTVNSPVNGISSDTAFTIQEVDIEMSEDGTTIEYVYTIHFGGKLVGIREFLESLIPQTWDVTDVDIIYTIQYASETMTMQDDTPTRTLITPPFKYGPAGSPQGVWNEAEYA